MMPNPYAIYLHDTNAKQLFARSERALSHGCIRLSDPDRLASLVLQIDGKNHNQAQSLIQLTQTTRIPLQMPLATHLAYFTSWVDQDGRLNTRADIYQHDAALKAALQTGNSLLSIMHELVASTDGNATDS